MLLLLFEYLHSLGFKIPTAFGYFSTRMILATVTALLFTIFFGPYFIKKLYAWKIGQPIRSVQEVPLLAQLHGKKKDTPTMGGILILSSMLIALLLWMDLRNIFTWILFLTTIVLGLLGAADDYLKLRKKNSKGLRGRFKMAIQIGLSALLAIYLLTPSVTNFMSGKKSFKAPVAKEQILEAGRIQTKTLSTKEYIERFYLPFFKEPVFIFPAFLAFLFIIFVITGSSNAVNLTDGLDGLAAGCLVMVSLVLALFAFLSNHIDLARYLH